jgi:hypothetical protein
VGVGEEFHCPKGCGDIFASEEAHRGFCPDSCPYMTQEAILDIRRAANHIPHSVFVLGTGQGTTLKVDTSLEYCQEQWWWRNVGGITVRHYETLGEAQEACERLRLILAPVFDVDPDAIGKPLGLDELPPDVEAEPKSLPISLRVGDTLDSRIARSAALEGISVTEWVRRACWKQSGPVLGASQDS